MDPERQRRVRTFNSRRGRLTPAIRAELGALGPQLALPDGVAVATAFGRAAPLVLEVGCGFGHAALSYATAHPLHDVLAVDVHTRGVAHLVARVARSGPPNLRVIEADALDVLADRLARRSLAALHLFFPDPWPKRAHHQRRFVRPDVAELVVDRLAPGGSFLVATDDLGYAEQAEAVLGGHPALSGGVADRPAWRPVAGYEAKAVAAGRPVVDLRYTRDGRASGVVIPTAAAAKSSNPPTR